MKNKAQSLSRYSYLLRLIFIAAVYFISARVSLMLQFESSNAAPVWIPSGFAFAVLLIFGYEIVPGIFIGAFFASLALFISNQTTSISAAVFLSLLRIGNSLEGILGLFILRAIIPSERFSGLFHKSRFIFNFILSAILMCAISALAGASTIYSAGIINAEKFPFVMFTWWMGDFSSVLLITPLIVLWNEGFKSKASSEKTGARRLAETILMLMVSVMVNGAIFCNWFPLIPLFRWAFWIIPVLVWAAIRLQPRETISLIVLCSAFALWGTLNRLGPFAVLSLTESLLTMQAFTSIMVISILPLNALVQEQRNNEEALREAGTRLETHVAERTAQLIEKNRELEKSRQTLSNRNNFIETIIETSEELIAVYDKELKLISLNRACEEMLGVNRDKLIGKKLNEIYPEIIGTKSEQDILNALKGELIRNEPFYSGVTNRYLQNYLAPLKDEHGNIYAALAIAYDVTEIKRAEDELQKSKEHFSQLFNVSPVAMSLSLASDGEVIDINSAWEKLFGLSKEQVIGKNAAELALSDTEKRAEGVQQVMSSDKSIHGIEMTFHLAHGRTLYAYMSVASIYLNNQQCFITAFVDITDRKQAEEEIRIQTEKVIRQNAELEKMNEELASFAYISSHDLQEPLRKIQTFSTRIIEKESNRLSVEAKYYFTRITAAAARMQQLINDLLAYSRTGTEEKKFIKTDLNELLDEVREEMLEKINTKTSIVSDALPQLEVIPFQFKQLFTNLISNAIKFAKPESAAIIKIRYKEVKLNEKDVDSNNSFGKYHLITVEDNGIGFDQEQSEHIFGVFQRLHSRGDYEGTGIGLSIVKKIVENHRGIIKADGVEGKGAVFSIYLPQSNHKE